MSITVACPSCQSRLKAPDNAVGRRVKCPKCGIALAIHVPQQSVAPFEALSPPIPTMPTPPAQRSNRAVLFLIAGGGALAVLLLTVVLILVFSFGGSKPSAEATVRKTLDAWSSGRSGGLASLRGNGVDFYDYDCTFCDAKLAKYEVAGFRKGGADAKAEADVVLIFESSARPEPKARKAYVVYQHAGRWKVIPKEEGDTSERFKAWLQAVREESKEGMKQSLGRAAASRMDIVVQGGGDAEDIVKIQNEKIEGVKAQLLKFKGLVKDKAKAIQNLIDEESDPAIKRMLQAWLAPIASELPDQAKLPAQPDPVQRPENQKDPQPAVKEAKQPEQPKEPPGEQQRTKLLAELEAKERDALPALQEENRRLEAALEQLRKEEAALRRNPRFGDPFNKQVMSQFNALLKKQRALAKKIRKSQKALDQKVSDFEQERRKVLVQFPVPTDPKFVEHKGLLYTQEELDRLKAYEEEHAKPRKVAASYMRTLIAKGLISRPAFAGFYKNPKGNDSYKVASVNGRKVLGDTVHLYVFKDKQGCWQVSAFSQDGVHVMLGSPPRGFQPAPDPGKEE